MQSFFCLGGVFLFWKHSKSEPCWDRVQDGEQDSDGHTWKGDTEKQARCQKGGKDERIQSISTPAPPPEPLNPPSPSPPCSVPEWHAITSGPAPSQRSLKLLHHLAAPSRWESEKEIPPLLPPPPMLPHPPSPRHHIKYHEIISVISMEICLQIISTPLPPFLPFICPESLSLWAVFTSLSYTIILRRTKDRDKKKKNKERKRYRER